MSGNLQRDKQHEVGITPTLWPGERDIIVDLFREYQDWLGEAQCFHDFQAELAGLPGDYAEPSGCLLLARLGDQVIGMAGLVPFEGAPKTCEMKRLYVVPDCRGKGAGRALAVAILDIARDAGYATMRLETLLRLETARSIYASLGFVDTGHRHAGDTSSPVIMQLDLA